MSITGTIQEGVGTVSRTAIISVLAGTTVDCGTYFAPIFSTLTVGGTLNTGVVYIDNSTAGNQFLNGSGVITTATFIGSGGGTVEFSNGVLNVTSSATIGPFGPYGTQRLSSTFQQDSGTVNITGTGDGLTLGTNSTSGNGTYTQLGGVLNVPNEYVELCYSSGSATTAFQVLGSATSPATANVYGISFGQTVNNGTQNGNGTVKLGDVGSRLVIGAGGIVSATSGTAQFTLGVSTGGGTLASSAPWSTTVPLNLGGSLPTNIDASAGTISLDGTLSGGGGLKEIGSGLLVLGGTNTYTGGTYVAGGELMATNDEAIEDGTNVFVGSDLGAFGTIEPSAAGLPVAGGTSPVPEPGTLTLVAAAGAAVLLLRRRRRR